MPNGNKTKPTKPTDRQPKKAKAVRTDDGFVVTIRGIEVTVLLDALNDWELLDALAELDEDRPESASVLPSLLRRALGPGDNKRVMNLLRDPSTGRVPLDAGVRFVAELFGAINPNG